MGKNRKLFGKRRPHRKRIFIAAAAGVLVICAAGAAIVSAFGARGQTEDEEEDALAGEQERISRIYTEEYQESVQTRLDNAKNSGNYTEDAMLIEPNPYGTNSLSLYVYFKTEDAARVSYTVSLEDGDISDFSASPASEEAYGTEHEFQVTGLVPDMENTVTFTVSYEDGKSSIASHGANPYTALITNWSPFPTIRPRGASRQSVMGAVMITISSGFKKFFDQSGVILSTRISTYFRRIVESMAGMMEEE